MIGKVGFLPVGKINNTALEIDLQAGRSLIERLTGNHLIAPPAFEELDVRQRALELASSGIDLLVIYPLHGMTARQQLDAAICCNKPTVLWALQSNYSFSSALSALGELRERDHPVKLVLGAASEDHVQGELLNAIRAAGCIRALREARIGVLGGIMPNLVASNYHPDVIRSRLGPQLVRLLFHELKEHLGESAKDSPIVQKACVELVEDPAFDVKASQTLLERGMSFHLALRAMAARYGLNAVVLDCFSELIPMFGINPCLGFIDGEGYLIGCEGDVVMTVHSLILRTLTGEDSFIGDVASLIDGVLKIGHCAGPAGLAEQKPVAIAEQDPPATQPVSNRLVMVKPSLPLGVVTLSRLHGRNSDKMHVAIGELEHCSIEDRPFLQIRLENPTAFLRQACGNHYLVSRGDRREALKLLSEWLGIVMVES